MRPPMPSMRLSRRAKIALSVVGVLLVLLILSASLVNVYINWLWFGEVGYRSVYTKVFWTRVVLFFVFGLLMVGILGANMIVAHRLRPPFRPMSPEQQNLERYRIALEPRKKLAFAALLAVVGLSVGASQQGNWATWQLWFNGGSFHQKDPQFHLDISFFAWDYPLYRLLLGYFYVVVILSILFSAGVYYLYGALRLQTPGPKITIAARRHLTVLVFFFIVLKALSYWLDRYGLVFSGRGRVTGASYTDVNASLPAKTILFWLAVIIAAGVLASIWMSSPLIPAVSFGVLLVLSIVISGIYPALVQQISVKPNASVKEAKFISRNIVATRAAYGIGDDTVKTMPFTGVANLSQSALVTATSATTPSPTSATLQNTRLLDPNVVSPSFTQYQRIQNFYGFPDKLDVDRYSVNGTTSDYVVGVRELKASSLSGDQTNWINEHSVYTHGYGFVSAPADNGVTQSGDFTEGGIPSQGDLGNFRPQVYYGELGADYSIVGASGGKAEYDGDQQTTTYSGSGGVKLSNIFTRAAFAVKYGQTNFLLNDTVSAKGAKIIFNRNPRERVLKVAPWLKIDGDPYPVVENGRIVWILDGYTTISQYPYSEKEQLGNLTQDSLTTTGRTDKQSNTTFNYIRNSVKATVDAYDGTVHLYAWDDTDPVLKAWMKTFPGTVEPKADMPAGVLAHIRYPQDLFEVQRALLAKYHVTDPVQFYNVRDQWTVPDDPFLSGKGTQPPYYVLAANPAGGSTPQYQLTTPMLVNNSTNLAAYISVNSEAGPNYGKMTVLRLPGNTSVFGPEQVASQFKSNTTQFQVQGATNSTTISADISSFGSGDSTVIYGNLLTLPVGTGLMYVEPLYVQAGGVTQPALLRRVIVYYGDQVGYNTDLAGALNNLKQQSSTGSVTPPTNSSSPPSSSPAPSSTPPTTTPSTGATSVDQVLTELDAATARLSAAYKSGNFTEIGAATTELQRLLAQYEKLRPSPTPSATKTK